MLGRAAVLGRGLLDPCEREATDVLAGMGLQEREDITTSAQVCRLPLSSRRPLSIFAYIFDVFW